MAHAYSLSSHIIIINGHVSALNHKKLCSHFSLTCERRLRTRIVSYFFGLFFFGYPIMRSKRLIRHCAAIVCQRWEWSGEKNQQILIQRPLIVICMLLPAQPAARFVIICKLAEKKKHNLPMRSQRHSAGA